MKEDPIVYFIEGRMVNYGALSFQKVVNGIFSRRKYSEKALVYYLRIEDFHLGLSTIILTEQFLQKNFLIGLFSQLYV